jgi:hypothetical protein
MGGWQGLVIGLLLVVTLGSTAVARADVVELTTGKRVEGRDARIGGDFVTLVVGERTIFLRRSEVRALYLGPPPPPCPKPS